MACCSRRRIRRWSGPWSATAGLRNGSGALFASCPDDTGAQRPRDGAWWSIRSGSPRGRTALDVAIQFRGLNGYELAESVTDADVVTVVLAVAAGKTDEARLAAWIRERLVPLPPDVFFED